MTTGDLFADRGAASATLTRPGKIHAARLSESKRLQCLLAVLRDGAWHSVLELHQATGSMACHTDMSELKANGIWYEQRYNGLTENGRRVSEYRLKELSL